MVYSLYEGDLGSTHSHQEESILVSGQSNLSHKVPAVLYLVNL